MRNVLNRNFRENSKHTFYVQKLCFPKIVPFMRYVENMVEPDRSYMPIKCGACTVHAG
jgi:hypothetical protein